MLDDHGHADILGRSQPDISLDVQLAFATGTLLKLEGIFLLQHDILQMTTHNGSMQFPEAFLKELIIIKIPSWRGNHVHHIQVGAKLRTVYILYQAQALIRTAGYHPRHALYAELGVPWAGCVDDFAYHPHGHIPQLAAEIVAVTTIPARAIGSTHHIHAASGAYGIGHVGGWHSRSILRLLFGKDTF